MECGADPAEAVYLFGRRKSAAQSDVRALVPSVESFNSDNTGTAGDVDSQASTSGYQGMTLALLKSQYDQSIDNGSNPA